MRDYLTLRVAGTENKRHLWECKDSKSETGHSLYVQVEASHAGSLNGNARWYRPDHMQDGVASWLPKGRPGKPVLIGHDRNGDPQGRVAKARYVDLSYEHYGKLPGVKSLSFYDGRAAASKKLNLFESIDWVIKNLQGKDDFRGLGYLGLDLNITNPETIAKIQREEYATVSVGFRTDAAICSICHTDWAAEDKCEHADDLGGKVDGKKVFLISGHFEYDELSFVTFPADPWGIVTSKEMIAGVADSLQNRIFFLGMPESDQKRILSFTDGLLLVDGRNIAGNDIHPAQEPGTEENDMDLKAIQAEIAADELTKERALELRTELSEVTDKASKRVLTSLKALIRKNKWAAPVSDLTTEIVQGRIDTLAETLSTLPAEDRPNYIARIEGEAAMFNLDFTAPVLEEVKSSEELADVIAAEQAKSPASAKSVKDAQVLAKLVSDNYVSDETKTEEEKTALKAAGSKAVEQVEALHDFYEDIESEELQRYFRYTISALNEHWNAGSTVEYYKARLAAGAMWDALIPQKELDTLQEGFEQAETELAQSKTSIDSLAAANRVLLRDHKKALAQLVVFSSVLLGEKGFTGLDAVKLSAEVSLREKRSLVSLQDAVTDLSRKLPGIEIEAPQTSAVSQPPAGAKEISDSAQLSNADGTAAAAGDATTVETAAPAVNPRYVDSDMANRARVKSYQDRKNKSSKE